MPVTSPAFSLSTNNRSKSWGSLAGSLVVKSFIVTLRLSDCVALYLYYCAVLLLSYYVVPFLSYCVERGLVPRAWKCGPRTPLQIKLISLFLRQVDLASASESLCRGLGSRWFTERFHRNALVTHFQHGQVFCTARQLKDYAVTRCRLHQRAPKR